MSLGRDFLADHAYEIDRGQHPSDILSRIFHKNKTMSISLKSITHGAVIRPPRMILLGVEKIGKSTFAAGASNPIFIPIRLEEGVDSLDVPKFPVAKNFQDVLDALEVLRTEDHDYETAVLDSASALEPVIWEAVCEENGVSNIEKAGGGYGKGYLESLYKWHTLMEKLDALRDEKNMAIVLIGHVKVKRFDDPERPSYDQYQFDINDKVSSALYRWADFIGFANINIDVTVEEQGFKKQKIKAIDMDVGNRYLFTQKTPAHPGGGRGVFGQLPPQVLLTWEAFQEAVSEILAEQNKAKKAKKKA
jgi:hypothetical protein